MGLHRTSPPPAAAAAEAKRDSITELDASKVTPVDFEVLIELKNIARERGRLESAAQNLGRIVNGGVSRWCG